MIYLFICERGESIVVHCTHKEKSQSRRETDGLKQYRSGAYNLNYHIINFLINYFELLHPFQTYIYARMLLIVADALSAAIRRTFGLI